MTLNGSLNLFGPSQPNHRLLLRRYTSKANRFSRLAALCRPSSITALLRVDNQKRKHSPNCSHSLSNLAPGSKSPVDCVFPQAQQMLSLAPIAPSLGPTGSMPFAVNLDSSLSTPPSPTISNSTALFVDYLRRNPSSSSNRLFNFTSPPTTTSLHYHSRYNLKPSLSNTSWPLKNLPESQSQADKQPSSSSGNRVHCFHRLCIQSNGN